MPGGSRHAHYRGPSREDLVAQPHEVCFKLSQHSGRGEIPRERLVAMKQIPGILMHYDVDRIE